MVSTILCALLIIQSAAVSDPHTSPKATDVDTKAPATKRLRAKANTLDASVPTEEKLQMEEKPSEEKLKMEEETLEPANIKKVLDSGKDTTAMEKQLTDLMMGAGGGGATPMGKSIAEIERVIDEEMIAAVTEAHHKNQKQLEQEVDSINECSQTKHEQTMIASKSKHVYFKAGPAHKLCRAGEAGKFTEKRDIHAEMKDKLKIKELKCKEFATADKMYATQKSNTEVVRKGGGEGSESYIRRITSTFCGKANEFGRGGAGKNGFLDEYLLAKSECEHATKEHNAQVQRFRKVTAQYNHERATCDSLQDQMDSASCKRSTIMKDACETYSECYMDRRRSHEATVKVVKVEEVDRKAEWRGLKRMQCLIVAFKDGKIKNSEIKTCKDTTHSTDHLIIAYPEIPVFEVCSVPDLYPSTAAYKLKEFAPLPAFAKGKQDANECVGIATINVRAKKFHDGQDPKHCQCNRVTLNGPYSAGALVKCSKCRPIATPLDKSSCPEGTKLFSPRTPMDWKTIYSSVDLPKQGNDANATPYLIIDVQSPQHVPQRLNSTIAPFNSHSLWGQTFKTSDGSPWWIRDSAQRGKDSRIQPHAGPGGYMKGCYIGVYLNTPNSPEANLTFEAVGCPPQQDSYYCQSKEQSLVPKQGSPSACKCSPVVLAGPYSAGSLMKCSNCLDVHKSTEKNSCPIGTKIFSPATRSDWKTVLASAAPLRSPHWIVDVTRPQNGCGGCTTHSMKSTTPAQITWRTSDGSPWWLRSTTYTEPNGDYTANCYMDLWKTPVSEQDITFNDGKCHYHSNAYYCQPAMEKQDTPTEPVGDDSEDGGEDEAQ